MKTIQELHRDWASKCLPKDAPQVQRQETECAFYAGAFSCFTLQMVEVALLPDDKAEAALQNIQDELEDYFRLLRTIPGTHGTQRQ